MQFDIYQQTVPSIQVVRFHARSQVMEIVQWIEERSDRSLEYIQIPGFWHHQSSITMKMRDLDEPHIVELNDAVLWTQAGGIQVLKADQWREFESKWEKVASSDKFYASVDETTADKIADLVIKKLLEGNKLPA